MRARQFCGFFDFRAGCAGLAVCDILQHRPGEQVDFLLHHADGFAQALLRQCADVLPVDADAAARHIVEARNQVAQRGFARAGRPDQGNRLPRTDGHVQVVDDLGVVVLIVEGNVVERDFAPDIRQHLRVRRVHNLRRGVHDFKETVDASHAALELLGEFNDAADGVQQHVRIQQIRHEVRRAEPTCLDEQCTADDDHDVHQPVKNAVRRAELRHHAVRLRLEVQELRVAVGELLFLDFLIRERLHHADAQQRIFHLRVDFTHLLVALLENPPHLGVEALGEVEHERQHSEHHQRHGDIHRAEDDEGHENLHACNQEFLRAVMRKLGDFKQVGRDARHNLPDFRVRVVAEGQLLQVVEDVVAHICFQLAAHDMPDGLHVVIRRRVDDTQQHVDTAHHQHERHRQRRDVVGRAGRNRADNQRQHQLADGRQRRAAQVERHGLAVLAEVGEEAPDKDAGTEGIAVLLLCHTKKLLFVDSNPLYHEQKPVSSGFVPEGICAHPPQICAYLAK